MRYCLLVLTFIVILSNGIVAQVRVLLTDSSIAPGEQTELVYMADVPVGGMPIGYSRLPDSFRAVEVIQRLGVDSVRSGDRMLYSDRYVLTAFDSGVHIIPPRTVEWAGKKMLTDSARLHVIPIRLEGEDYQDIRDIVDVEKPGMPFVYWFFLVVLILVSVGLSVWFFRSRTRNVERPARPADAFARAMQALDELRQQDRTDARTMKVYFECLYDVFRDYCTGVTGFSMLHLTAGELLPRMKASMGNHSFDAMAAVFRIVDAVKFASYTASEAEALDCLERLRTVILEMEQNRHRG